MNVYVATPAVTSAASSSTTYHWRFSDWTYWVRVTGFPRAMVWSVIASSY